MKKPIIIASAYEHWLVETADKCIEENPGHNLTPEIVIAALIQKDVLDQGELAFELLERTGDKEYTTETFKKAAQLVLKKFETETV